MSPSRREFQIGERVLCRGVFPREYGVITQITTDAPKDGPNSVAVQRYELALDDGTTFTALNKHLRHVEEGQ